MAKREFTINDRVYYVKNGPEFTGTVQGISPDPRWPYAILWDNNPRVVDWHAAGQLALLPNTIDEA